MGQDMMKIRCLALVGLCSVPRIAMAGGTLGADEVFAVVRQNVDMSDSLASAMEFRCSAWAETRLGTEVVPALGGQRVGPYTLWARRRGSKGPWTLELTVETRPRWFDASGTEVPADQFPSATSVRETLEGVRLRPCSEACDAQADQKPCTILVEPHHPADTRGDARR